MKPEDLKVGQTYVYKPHKSKDSLVMILLSKNEEDLVFATYNTELSRWYIPDIWNYDLDGIEFLKFDQKMFSYFERRDIISRLFWEWD